MAGAGKKDNSKSLSTEVFELPSEHAVVINVLPPVTPNDGNLVPCETVRKVESHESTDLGVWLVGREVRKKFGRKFYNGVVTEFDNEAGYRVAYEDGDSEDLDWDDLEKVLVPLDINVPLKTLAAKVLKQSKKHSKKSASK